MLVEIALADAYGAGFEFAPQQKIEDFNDGKTYQKHEKYGFVAQYTDDTQMSLAVAETLIRHENPGKKDFAEAFVSCFRRDQREGYSSGFY